MSSIDNKDVRKSAAVPTVLQAPAGAVMAEDGAQSVADLESGRARDLFEQLHQLMHLYRAQQYRILRDGPYDISHLEHRVLAFLARHPGATQSDLVMHFGRDKAQMARLVRGLRDRELVCGEVDAQDRRSTRLSLSSTGRQLYQSLRTHGEWLATQTLQDLNSVEQEQLQALVQRLHRSLSAL